MNRTIKYIDFERTTLNIADDTKVFVRIEQKTGESEVVRYQYDNHLGSACLELDELGAIISYEEYHPFGTTSYRSGRSETEVSLKRYKYNGKERDEETGLYYYGARYYAAWLCQFISTDPLKEKYKNWSPFVYCADNPVKYIDKDGKNFDNYKIYHNGKIEVQRTGDTTNTYTYVKEDGTEVNLGTYDVTTNSTGEDMVKIGDGATGSNDIFQWANINSGNLYFEENAFAGLVGAIQDFYNNAGQSVDKVMFTQFMSLEKMHSGQSSRTSAFDVALYDKNGKTGVWTDNPNISDNLNEKLGDSLSKFGLGSSNIFSQAGGEKGTKPYLFGKLWEKHHHHFHFEGFSGKVTEVSGFNNTMMKENQAGERWKPNYEGERATKENATWTRGKWGELKLIRK